MEAGAGREVWVVEDQWSAMRLWQEGVSAVALLGTHINHERAVEISSVSRDVLIALDKDATARAIQYATQYRYAFNAKVIALEKDIKDTSIEELKQLIHDST
jgi:DNA primase